MKRKVSGSIGIGGVCAVALLAAGTPSAAGVQAAPGITTVMGGLNSPRGIAFDGRGSMYLSESGAAGAGAAGLTQTGKVSKFDWGSNVPAWTDAFTSFYARQPGAASADVLGPEGISALGNGCRTSGQWGDKGHDGRHHEWRREGHGKSCQVAMIMSESTPGIFKDSGGALTDTQAGRLFGLDGATGAVRRTVDVGAQMYAWTGANKSVFPSDFPDSNPYGVLVTKDEGDAPRTFVADAGANTISEIMADGTARIIAYIPNESGPPFRDATPTCMAQGPDGYLYVGTLHFVNNLLVPPVGGKSDVWRVDPNADYPEAPELWASGLTTVTACTFDDSDNFWATEMFAGGLTAKPFPGDVVKIPFDDPTQQTHIGAGQLPVPGGIAQGPDGAMYVTVGSAGAPGQGGVVKIG
jgi:hypothetical protein